MTQPTSARPQRQKHFITAKESGRQPRGTKRLKTASKILLALLLMEATYGTLLYSVIADDEIPGTQSLALKQVSISLNAYARILVDDGTDSTIYNPRAIPNQSDTATMTGVSSDAVLIEYSGSVVAIEKSNGMAQFLQDGGTQPSTSTSTKNSDPVRLVKSSFSAFTVPGKILINRQGSNLIEVYHDLHNDNGDYKEFNPLIEGENVDSVKDAELPSGKHACLWVEKDSKDYVCCYNFDDIPDLAKGVDLEEVTCKEFQGMVSIHKYRKDGVCVVSQNSEKLSIFNFFMGLVEKEYDIPAGSEVKVVIYDNYRSHGIFYTYSQDPLKEIRVDHVRLPGLSFSTGIQLDGLEQDVKYALFDNDPYLGLAVVGRPVGGGNLRLIRYQFDKCSSGCWLCSEPAEPSKCLMCEGSIYFMNEEGTQCESPGAFLPCLEVQYDSNPALQFDGMCLPECFLGYGRIGNYCKSCASPYCIDCQSSYEVCTQCHEDFFKDGDGCVKQCEPKETLNSECLDTCPDDFYSDNLFCKPCVGRCETCTYPGNEDSCLSCGPGYRLNKWHLREYGSCLEDIEPFRSTDRCQKGQIFVEGEGCKSCEEIPETCNKVIRFTPPPGKKIENLDEDILILFNQDFSEIFGIGEDGSFDYEDFFEVVLSKRGDDGEETLVIEEVTFKEVKLGVEISFEDKTVLRNTEKIIIQNKKSDKVEEKFKESSERRKAEKIEIEVDLNEPSKSEESVAEGTENIGKALEGAKAQEVMAAAAVIGSAVSTVSSAASSSSSSVQSPGSFSMQDNFGSATDFFKFFSMMEFLYNLQKIKAEVGFKIKALLKLAKSFKLPEVEAPSQITVFKSPNDGKIFRKGGREGLITSSKEVLILEDIGIVTIPLFVLSCTLFYLLSFVMEKNSTTLKIVSSAKNILLNFVFVNGQFIALVEIETNYSGMDKKTWLKASYAFSNLFLTFLSIEHLIAYDFLAREHTKEEVEKFSANEQEIFNTYTEKIVEERKREGGLLVYWNRIKLFGLNFCTVVFNNIGYSSQTMTLAMVQTAYLVYFLRKTRKVKIFIFKADYLKLVFEELALTFMMIFLAIANLAPNSGFPRSGFMDIIEWFVFIFLLLSMAIQFLSMIVIIIMKGIQGVKDFLRKREDTKTKKRLEMEMKTLKGVSECPSEGKDADDKTRFRMGRLGGKEKSKGKKGKNILGRKKSTTKSQNASDPNASSNLESSSSSEEEKEMDSSDNSSKGEL